MRVHHSERCFQEQYTVDPVRGCWLWLYDISTNGYGRIWKNKKRKQAHRHSWELHHGPIPVDKQVLHTCDVRRCVNPGHLYLGNHDDNMADMAERGRGRGGWQLALKTHCPRGHEYSEANTHRRRGSRECRACGAEKARERRQRAGGELGNAHGR